ncbi:MAG TPA: zinc ABC transporter substrate-binding protein [Campylobacterales bacterium]|nr:zinc ABC transporter substrate-binding protein [Campylobacterales bacterium]
MKKFLTLLLLFSATIYAKTDVLVSIVPQKYFVEKIGGEKVDVAVMVEKGTSPHDYTPKPSQMKKVSKAQIYFSIGVEFEEVWLPKFQNQNKKMQIVDSSLNVRKHVAHHNCSGQHDHNHENLSIDPHIWVDPINVKTIANNIYKTLMEKDAQNAQYYTKNYNAFLKELDTLHNEIQKILKETPAWSYFMVFHPSWGYFAKRYQLIQLPVEIEGKEPKMKDLISIINKAKKLNVKAIFTQPEFSDKASKIIAKQLNIEVVKASPLAENWAENLKFLASSIAHKK